MGRQCWWRRCRAVLSLVFLMLALHPGTAWATSLHPLRESTILPQRIPARRPATPTPANARPTPTPRATNTPMATPTPTLIVRCGDGFCAILTPTAIATTGAGGGGTGGGRNSSGPSCDFWNIGTWGPCLLAGVIDDLTTALTELTSSAAQTNIWSYTDPLLTYTNPTVQRYWDGIRLLADAFLGLLLLGIATEILLGVRSGQPYAGALERFWRVLLVALLANGSLALIGQAIDLSNLAVGGLDAVQQSGLLHLGRQAGPPGASGTLLHSLLSFVDALMALLVFVQMVIRLGLLTVLIALAPLGLLCYAWPRLQGWGELWGRLFVATPLTQFVQIAALNLGEDLARNGPGLILPGNSAGTTWLGFLIAFGVFVVVLRVPRILRGYTGTPLAISLLAIRAIGRRIRA